MFRFNNDAGDAVKAKLNLGSMRFGKNAAELRRDGKDPGRRADVYPTVLLRPVCGGCGKPMALSRSTGKYKSFVCLCRKETRTGDRQSAAAGRPADGAA